MKSSKVLILLNFFLWQCHGINGMEEARQGGQASFPGVIKINDDLYVGKVAEDFYLAMERVNQKNIGKWLNYGQLQDQKNFSLKLTQEGSSRFKMVLKIYKNSWMDYFDNELWVAYASNIPVKNEALLKTNEDMNSIEMYVTVITSPAALVSSHMGISRTWEAAIALQKEPSKRKPNQSLHLHSFAAKVIKIRDPKKVYMFTDPASVMGEILINKMPAGSVFVGDDLYQKRVEAAKKDPMSLLGPELVSLPISDETQQEREKRLKNWANDLYEFDKIDKKFSLLKTHPPRIIRIKEREKYKGLKEKQIFTLQNPDGTPLVTFDQDTLTYNWVFTEAYRDTFDMPYFLIDLDVLANFGALEVLTPE